MKIGLSLKPEYIAGIKDDIMEPALGSPENCLRSLKESGVESIELRAVTSDTNPTVAREAIKRIQDAGLSFTIHGAISETPSGAEILPESTLQLIPESGIVVSVHSFQSLEESTETLTERTIRTVSSIMRNYEDAKIPVRIAIELNRSKGVNDPGTSYDRLTYMIETIDHPNVGICWDFGHTSANVRLGLMTTTPPHNFVSRVIHTHIHEIGPDGGTHWPVVESAESTTRDRLRLLAESGYNGIANIELGPDRFKDDVGVREGIFGSIKQVALMLKTIGGDKGN